MINKYEDIIRRGLPGGPNEEITYSSGFSTEGYKRNSPDVDNPFNIIPSGRITMRDVDFPVTGLDEFGNEKRMFPGFEYDFPGNVVLEIPHRQEPSVKGHGNAFMNSNALGYSGHINSKNLDIHGTYLKPLQELASRNGSLDLGLDLKYQKGSNEFSVSPSAHLGKNPQFGINVGFKHNFQEGGEQNPYGADKYKNIQLIYPDGSIKTQSMNEKMFKSGYIDYKKPVKKNFADGTSKTQYNYNPEGGFGLPRVNYKDTSSVDLSRKQDGGENGVSNLNDLYISASDFNELNQGPEGEYFCDPYGKGCLASSYDSYNKLIGQRYPSSDFLNENRLKENYGVESLQTADYYNPTGYQYDAETDEFVHYTDEVEDDRFGEGSNTYNWIKNQPAFSRTNQEGKTEYDFTADSWDIHGMMVGKGGKSLFNTTDENWINDESSHLTEEKLKELYKDMTPGTIIGYGQYADRKGENNKAGMVSSGHSTQVVGYDKRGVPVIYDYGKYVPIDGGTMYGVGDISNITIPKEHAGHNLEWAKEKGYYTGEDPKELDLNLDAIMDQSYFQDDDELPDFYKALKDKKFSLMKDLKIREDQYDEMSAALIGISMQETEGGGGYQHNIEQALPGTLGQDSSGLTQLMWSNISEDEQLMKLAEKYGITQQSDLKDSDKSAIASMIYGSRNYLAAQKNLKKGKGKQGVRTYRPPTWKGKAKDWKSDIKYDGKEFETDGGVNVDLFTGINFLGLGSMDTLEEIQKNLDAAAEEEGWPGRYTARYEKDEDGEEQIVIDKVTAGNSDLSPIDAFIYNWNSPYSLTSGDAQGGAGYVKNIKGWMDLIKKQSGGEITPKDIEAKQQFLEEELSNLNAFQLQPAQLLKMQTQLYDTYNENVPRKFKIGGPKLSPELGLYKDYVVGKDESQKARKNYDKLNRVYYREAKVNNMHPSNYIMTTMIS